MRWLLFCSERPRWIISIVKWSSSLLHDATGFSPMVAHDKCSPVWHFMPSSLGLQVRTGTGYSARKGARVPHRTICSTSLLDECALRPMGCGNETMPPLSKISGKSASQVPYSDGDVANIPVFLEGNVICHKSRGGSQLFTTQQRKRNLAQCATITHAAHDSIYSPRRPILVRCSPKQRTLQPPPSACGHSALRLLHTAELCPPAAYLSLRLPPSFPVSRAESSRASAPPQSPR